MNWSAPRNALAAAVLALTGVLLIAAGFLAATIVLDDRDTEATPATVLEATANPGTPAPSPLAIEPDTSMPRYRRLLVCGACENERPKASSRASITWGTGFHVCCPLTPLPAL